MFFEFHLTYHPLGQHFSRSALFLAKIKGSVVSWQGDFFLSFPGMCKGRIRLLFVEIDCISPKSHFNNLLEMRMNLGLERALLCG